MWSLGVIQEMNAERAEVSREEGDEPRLLETVEDVDFLAGPKLRAARMELELLKPELAFDDNNIHSTIVVFGGTRIVTQDEADKNLRRAKAQLADTPDDPRRQRAVDRAKRLAKKSHYYQLAREFAKLVSSSCQVQGKCAPDNDQ